MSDVLYELKDGIAWIRLNRPHLRNAVTAESVLEFIRLLKEASADDAAKVIIISSTGDDFCAGEDLKIALDEFAKIKEGTLHPVLDIVNIITEGLQEIPRVIRSARKIVIACTRGFTVGGGFEIAIDSDMIVAADTTKFGFPEGNAGMTVTGGATKLLPMMIGLNKARDLMITGEFMDADEAYRVGLVNHVVPFGEEEAEAERIAKLIMTRAPFSVVNHKRMIQNALEAGFEATLETEKQTITNMLYMEDYGEAITAFGEKRKPTFHGR